MKEFRCNAKKYYRVIHSTRSKRVRDQYSFFCHRAASWRPPGHSEMVFFFFFFFKFNYGNGVSAPKTSVRNDRKPASNLVYGQPIKINSRRRSSILSWGGRWEAITRTRKDQKRDSYLVQLSGDGQVKITSGRCGVHF